MEENIVKNDKLVIPLQFWFTRNTKLAIPLCAYKCNCIYVKEKILDYPTFFIKELFSSKYDDEYSLVEETNYVQYYIN